MRDLQHEEEQHEEPRKEDAVISGWTLKRYFEIVRTPVTAVVIAEMVLLILTKQNAAVWLLHLALFVYFALRTPELTGSRAMTLGAAAGFFAGLGMAIFRLVYVREFYFVFNLIAEPVLTAALGAAFTAVVHNLLTARREKKEQRQKSAQEPERHEDAPHDTPPSHS